jgi:hypothetical protein
MRKTKPFLVMQTILNQSGLFLLPTLTFNLSYSGERGFAYLNFKSPEPVALELWTHYAGIVADNMELYEDGLKFKMSISEDLTTTSLKIKAL